MIDLVCWDVGDSLVDERVLPIPPLGVPAWTEVYDRVVDARPDRVEEWMLGRASINDLVDHSPPRSR